MPTNILSCLEARNGSPAGASAQPRELEGSGTGETSGLRLLCVHLCVLCLHVGIPGAHGGLGWGGQAAGAAQPWPFLIPRAASLEFLLLPALFHGPLCVMYILLNFHSCLVQPQRPLLLPYFTVKNGTQRRREAWQGRKDGVGWGSGAEGPASPPPARPMPRC